MNNYKELEVWAQNVADTDDKDKMKQLKSLINDLAYEDFFGTEMQFDPRGDFRETYDHEECDEEECERFENGGMYCREDLEIIDKYNIVEVIKNLVNYDVEGEDQDIIREEIFMKLEATDE